jgi:hypothetical protein
MRYARSGAIPKIWDSTVQQIAQEMMQCGFSLPVGLRPMFIGRMASRVMFQGRRRELDQRPFKFLRVRNTFRSHGLVTVKTRGLPVKRQVNK